MIVWSYRRIGRYGIRNPMNRIMFFDTVLEKGGPHVAIGSNLPYMRDRKQADGVTRQNRLRPCTLGTMRHPDVAKGQPISRATMSRMQQEQNPSTVLYKRLIDEWIAISDRIGYGAWDKNSSKPTRKNRTMDERSRMWLGCSSKRAHMRLSLSPQVA